MLVHARVRFVCTYEQDFMVKLHGFKQRIMHLFMPSGWHGSC
jgi:hypothetical protein